MKNRHYHFIKYGLVLLSTFGIQAHADVDISGFASLRATAVDSDTSASPYARYQGDGDISFKDESLFGLQFSYDLSEKLTATAQLLAQGRNDFEVEAEWAYLRYQINDDHQLMVGRMSNPIFRQSQYQNVGYAHNYARLPLAVYSDFEITTLDGVALDSLFPIGNYTLETKLFYGNSNDSDQVLVVEDEMGVNMSFSSDWWEVYAGILQLDASIGTSPIQDQGYTYSFYGFTFNYSGFIFDMETVEYDDDDSAFGATDGRFVSLGYQLGDVIVTVHDEDFDRGGMFVPEENKGQGVSIRYDFQPGAALKVDYFSGEQPVSVSIADPGPPPVAESAPVGDFDMVSIGVDLVF